MLDWQLGVCPIQTEQPSGSNPRDGDTFALLEAEINKRLDLHGQAPTDWALVSRLANTVLRDEGKDLSVATWLLLGWVYCKDAEGLAAGVRVLHDVHVHYWDSMTPPAARLRGRRNQIEWLLQELDTVITRNSEGWAALTPQQHAELIADWDALDALWQEHDEQAPPLFKLRRMLTDLAPPEEDAGATTAGELDAPVSGESHTSLAGKASDVSNASNVSNASDATSASNASDASPATNASSAPAPQDASDSASVPGGSGQSSALPASVTQVTGKGASSKPPVKDDARHLDDAVLDSADAVERVIEHGFDAMHAALSDLPDELIVMPVLYRLNRVRAWLTLDTVPPAVDGLTRIPAPPPADQEGLQRLIDADDPLSILRFAESRLGSHRFWLDLNRIAYQAALRLPDGKPIGDAIAFDSVCLLQRLPGLQAMSFINGQPFADQATHDWLASVGTRSVLTAGVPPASASAGASEHPVSADSLSMATLLAVASAETQAAVRLLDVVATRLQTGSKQFIQQ